AHNELVDAALTRAIGSRTLDEMMRLFETANLTPCPVYDHADLPQDHHARRRGPSASLCGGPAARRAQPRGVRRDRHRRHRAGESEPRGHRMTKAFGLVTGMLLTVLVGFAPTARAADYGGPLIDAHSHVPNGTAIDAYVAAMKRHNVAKVVLLGVGGRQKDDTTCLTAASKKYPDRVVAGLPLPDPTTDAAASQLEVQLERGRPRVIGGGHMRQVGGQLIDRDPNGAAFGRILAVVGKLGFPIVLHYELTDTAETALDRALAAHRKATIVLAHGGEGPPGRLDRL